MVMTDAELVQQAKDGSMDALGRLYDLHAGALFSFLRGMVDAHTAEDLVQDAFVAAAERLGEYEERGNFRAWLFSIARTRALDRLRRIRSFRDKQDEIGYIHTLSDQKTPDSNSADRELAAIVRTAVRQLPEMQQAVFLMREEGELSFKEIAAALHIPLNTALSHMHRALDTLREALAHHNPGNYAE